MKKEKSPDFKHAELYHDYAEKYQVYKISIQRLIDYCREEIIPKKILDLACGIGMTLVALEDAFPEAEFFCSDSSEFMLKYAKNNSRTRTQFISSRAEEIEKNTQEKFDAIFCNAAFWYFDRDRALSSINKVLVSNGFFFFNMSEPSIDFGDSKYDDRFLQTMVEVLDSKGIVFHRDEGKKVNRLRLSYKPPTIEEINKSLLLNGFEVLKTETWKFSKSLEELAEFYLIPGFGTKAFRELEDDEMKKAIIEEIIKRLRKKGISDINFRWAEFVAKKI